jgi:hypothetical protein
MATPRLEQQYFFLFPSAANSVFLKPDEVTAGRPLLGMELLPGPPLRFVDAVTDFPNAVEGTREITDVLHGPGMVAVRDHLRLRLENFDLPGTQFYPMVLDDAEGCAHGDFWLLHVFEERPFVDMTKSELLEGEDPDDPDDDGVMVLRFALDEREMERVPEEHRLIFRPAHVLNVPLFFHERIIKLLRAEKATGFRAFRVSEYEDGMEL